MVIRRGNVDESMLNIHTIDSLYCLQGSSASQDVWQKTRAFSRNVENDEDGSRQLLWKGTNQCYKRMYAAGRSSDNDDVVPRHITSLQ